MVRRYGKEVRTDERAGWRRGFGNGEYIEKGFQNELQPRPRRWRQRRKALSPSIGIRLLARTVENMGGGVWKQPQGTVKSARYHRVMR
ncbi:unnamed protein product [Linum trigynum]|uniref:Uncharacterized protein n=1 Tax=Linum trigynum TaxID=586398 RepID=A0AAV2CWS5_9ROSI